MSGPIPKDFRGLMWEPSNEQEVVLLFGRLLNHLPKPLAIEFVQTTFPDCKALDIGTGNAIWIEFELYNRHYWRDHLRRLEKCDWIVCWHDDLHDKRPNLPEIVALDTIVDKQPRPQDYIHDRRLPAETQEEYFRRRILGLSPHHQKVIRRLMAFAKAAHLRTEWPDTNGACFTVLDEVEYFKVESNGKIGTPFSRWASRGVRRDVTARVVQALNKSLHKEWFSIGGKRSIDVQSLLPDEPTVRGFINVWQRFADGSYRE